MIYINPNQTRGAISMVVALVDMCSVNFTNIETGHIWRIVIAKKGHAVCFPDWITVSSSLYVCVCVCVCVSVYL
jgi:hypothetical protein